MRWLLGVGVVLVCAACGPKRQPWSIAAADPATRRVLTTGPVVGGEGRYGSQAWLGIPFAAPPVGDLRWRAPQPPVAWQADRPALTFPSPCPQFASPLAGVEHARAGEIVGSEDCLGLNVWAPPGAARLPVMLWIHGGGNSIGTSSFYDGGHLATEGHVIVVSTQYRLGPLGWFRHHALRAGVTDPNEQSGNFGTLDLIEALKWVRANIAAFGGDPQNVTVFGESAGGTDVYSLLLAPAARGLFQRAIVESGRLSRTTVELAENWDEGASPGHFNSSNEVLARLAGSRERAVAMNDAEAAAFLRQRTPEELLHAYAGRHVMGMLQMPLVFRDGTVIAADEPINQFSAGTGWNRVPVMVGSNHDEMKLFMFFDPTRMHLRLGFWPKYVDEPLYQASADAQSRMWKATAVDEPAAAMVRSGAKAVYAYRFDWHGEPTVLGANLAQMLGAAHGFEIPFVFGHFDLGSMSKRLYDENGLADRDQLSNTMMSLWSSFARTGAPSAPGIATWSPWDDSAPDAPKYLVLDTPTSAIHMSGAAETREAILASVDANPLIPEQAKKCAVFRDLTGLTGGLTAAQYPHAGAKGCAEYPLEAANR